ncbi:MAG: cytochrome c maturation protein CcmE [Rhizobiales bacterium]|nr:cytochrome c maturation protein CcmE [Hyphomicrobiales bacterium]
MTRKQKRLAGIGAIGVVLMSAVFMVMFALNDEIVFFYSPTDVIVEKKAANGERFRLGGLVKEGSLVKTGNTVSFIITDTEYELKASYVGILPDLFREGQGVIAEGALNASGDFAADTVLAKHDENYISKEVADTLREKGVWQGNGPKNKASSGQNAKAGK